MASEPKRPAKMTIDVGSGLCMTDAWATGGGGNDESPTVRPPLTRVLAFETREAFELMAANELPERGFTDNTLLAGIGAELNQGDAMLLDAASDGELAREATNALLTFTSGLLRKTPETPMVPDPPPPEP
jgi:hypothetical protein